MGNKKYVGSLHTENDVLDKIAELKDLGFKENDIYVITNNLDTLSIVRGLTDVDLRSSEGGWLKRFISFLSGDEPVKSAFIHMGFTQEEAERYFNEVKNGGFLLYVDQEYAKLMQQKTEFQTGYTDPNIGSNFTVNYGAIKNDKVNS
ncbi:general stress protein [Sporosarcina siberiensis]|uniref:General stress protein n=1 Tax=Sporosarcina siberiensis TaxID=1365606 RepID=A0ABW4SI11_9BACL